KERGECFYGCAHPEGYRKALGKMRLAAKFGLPVVCLIDTPGAFPGIGAEERGQAQLIATNILGMARLPTPGVCVGIGAGGSGGAGGGGGGGPGASASATGWACWSTPGTRSSAPRGARASSGGRPTT